MGAKTNIAAITALSVTNLQDNIVFTAASEKKMLMLDKTSTAAVDNSTIWNATPSGRWFLVGPVPLTYIEVVADLAALKALTSAEQNRLYIINSTPPIIYNWDAQSTATDDNNLIVKLTSVATGRMYKIHPASVSSTIVSSTAPSTVSALGTTYIWKEDTSGTYPADTNGDYPNSVITYVSDGVAWVVTAARTIAYGNTPGNTGKLPKNIYERWLDTTTDIEYKASLNGSITLSWVIA